MGVKEKFERLERDLARARAMARTLKGALDAVLADSPLEGGEIQYCVNTAMADAFGSAWHIEIDGWVDDQWRS